MPLVQRQYSIECIRGIGFASVITVLASIKKNWQHDKIDRWKKFILEQVPKGTRACICRFLDHLKLERASMDRSNVWIGRLCVTWRQYASTIVEAFCAQVIQFETFQITFAYLIPH